MSGEIMTHRMIRKSDYTYARVGFNHLLIICKSMQGSSDNREDTAIP